MPLFRNLVTVALMSVQRLSTSISKAYQNELILSRVVGGQNWVKFRPRSNLMPSFKNWVTVAPMSVQWLGHQASQDYQKRACPLKGGRWSKLGKIQSTQLFNAPFQGLGNSCPHERPMAMSPSVSKAYQERAVTKSFRIRGRRP